MNRRNFLNASLTATALSLPTLQLLTGCGSGSKSLLLPNSSDTSSSGHRSIIVTIVWPKPSITRLIPAAAVKVVLEVKNGETLVTTKEVNKSDADASGTIPVKLDKLPAGNLLLTATAFGSEGAAQAKGQTSFTTKVGTPARTTVEMFTTIDRIEIKPENPSVAEGKTITLTAEAKNNKGEMVMVAPDKMKWTVSNPQNATINPSSGLNTVVTVKKPVTIEVIEEESGKKGSVTLEVKEKTKFYISSGNNSSLQVDWQSKIPVSTTLYEQNFEGFSEGSDQISFQVGPVLVSSQDANKIFYLSENFWGQAPNTANGMSLLAGVGTATLVFSTPVKGFGVWIFEDGYPEYTTYTMTVNGKTSPVLDPGRPPWTVAGFMGVIDMEGISEVSINSSSTYSTGVMAFEMDRFQVFV